MPESRIDDRSGVLDALRNQDTGRVGEILEGYRPRLSRMVALRMDPRLRRRIDPSDVLQEALADVTQRLPDYEKDPRMPFFLWVRFLVGQRLLLLTRSHLGTLRRSVDFESPISKLAGPPASSIAIADAFAASGPTPSAVAIGREQKERLLVALDELDGVDREVLVLRHFEHMSNAEVALVLSMTARGARARYMRALDHLATRHKSP